MSTDVLEEHITFIFRVEEENKVKAGDLRCIPEESTLHSLYYLKIFNLSSE
jgi:hypothetical protein